jgi:uncharacterized protein YtpQ (UPF0354 family)
MQLDISAVLPLIRSFGAGQPAGNASIEIDGESAPLVKPYIDDLHIVYVADVGSAYRYVNRGDLQRLELTLEELDAKAWSNFLSRCRDLALRITPTQSGLSHIITIGENLEASLLMYEPLWVNLAGRVEGRLVAACPARDVLVCCDADNPAAIQELRDGVERVWAHADKPLSRTLLEWMGDGWLPFEDD